MVIDDERLAAFASGDLDADEHARVAAAVADDPDLRARVDDLRRLDAALAHLPDPEPSVGFGQRLRAALDEEVAGGRAEVVRLDRRRPAPAWTRWLVPAAAAAVVVAAVVGVGLDFGGGSDEPVAAPPGGDVAELQQAPESADAPESAEAPAGAPENGAAELPVPVLALGRTLSVEDLEALAADAAADGAATAGAAAADDQAGAAAADDEAGGEAAAPEAEAAGEDQAPPGSPVSPQDRADVERCLAEVLTRRDAPLQAVSAELATLADEAVVVFRLIDVERGRAHVEAVARADCAPRFTSPSS